MANKKSVSLSVDNDIDDFFEDFKVQAIEIQGKEIKLTKSKNELYIEALRFAIRNADSWLFIPEVKEGEGD